MSSISLAHSSKLTDSFLSNTVFGCKNWSLELPIRNLKSRIPAFGCSWHSRAAIETNSESAPARLHLLSRDTEGFRSVLLGTTKFEQTNRHN